MEQDQAEKNAGAQGQGVVPKKGKRRSDVWSYFGEIFTDQDGEERAKCNKCGRALKCKTTSGTSTLRKHADICFKPQGESSSSLPSKQGKSSATKDVVKPVWDDATEDLAKLSRAQGEPSGSLANRKGKSKSKDVVRSVWDDATEDLAKMIALDGYDPSIVENSHFRSFLRRMNPFFNVPSRLEIEDICDEIFDQENCDIFKRLEEDTCGQVNLSIDEAHIAEGTFLYVACHFIDSEWKLRKMILDAFIVVPDALYHGAFLGGAFLGIRYVPDSDFDQRHEFIESCFSQLSDRLFSLVCGTIGGQEELKEFIEDWSTTNLACATTYLDLGLHSIADFFTNKISYDFIVDAHLAIKRLNLNRRMRERHLSELELEDLWTYKKGWYSFYCSLRVIHTVRPSKRDEEVICKILGAIYHAIRTISAPDSPTSHLCLRELFDVREVLQSELAEASMDDCYDLFAEVPAKATENLDKTIQDSYMAWSIPLVLDPRYKLSAIADRFRAAYGSSAETYIIEVKKNMDKIFNSYSQQSDIEPQNQGMILAENVQIAEHQEMQYNVNEDNRAENMMVDLQSTIEKSELDVYLEGDLVAATDGFDILNWWKDNASKYPTVAKMARGALAMATCSKLTSEQNSHIRSIIRGYSKFEYNDLSRVRDFLRSA